MRDRIQGDGPAPKTEGLPEGVSYFYIQDTMAQPGIVYRSERKPARGGQRLLEIGQALIGLALYGAIAMKDQARRRLTGQPSETDPFRN